MTKSGKKLLAAAAEILATLRDTDDSQPVVTYTLDADGHPLTRTVTRYGGRWRETSLLQAVTREDFERNLHDHS